MRAIDHLPTVRDAACGQPVGEATDVVEQKVVAPATEGQVRHRHRRWRLPQAGLEVALEHEGGGAERADMGKAVRRVQTDEQRLRAAHRQAADRPAPPPDIDRVAPLDQRQHLVEQTGAQQLDIAQRYPGGRRRQVAGHAWIAMPGRAYHQHGPAAAVVNQRVEHDVGAAGVEPGAGGITQAMQHIQHRVGAAGTPVITGRGVDVELAVAADGGGAVTMARHQPARHVAMLPRQRSGVGLARQQDHALPQARAGRLDPRVGGVEYGHAVDDEPVAIQVWRQHRAAAAPDAVGGAVQRQRHRQRVELDPHLTRRRRLHPENQRAVAAHFGRTDGWPKDFT